jgi:hypothetical protein
MTDLSELLFEAGRQADTAGVLFDEAEGLAGGPGELSPAVVAASLVNQARLLRDLVTALDGDASRRRLHEHGAGRTGGCC